MEIPITLGALFLMSTLILWVGIQEELRLKKEGQARFTLPPWRLAIWLCTILIMHSVAIF